MHLARLFIATILHRKVWVIWLLLMVVVPAVFPYMTPLEDDPTILQPARAQAAWVTLWVGALTWGLFQGAGFGEALARRGLGEYLSSQGVGKFSQLVQTWLACLAGIVPMLVAAAAVCLFWAIPSDPLESTAWIYLVVQYAALFLITVAALLLLAIGLGSRLGVAGGYLFTFALAIYGIHGVGYLSQFLKVKKDPLLELLVTFSPHYHLSSDMTERLIFKLGHVPSPDFLAILAYLLGLLVIHLLISYVSFRPQKR